MNLSGVESMLGLTYQYGNQIQKNNISNYGLVNNLYGTGYTNLFPMSNVGSSSSFAKILEKNYKRSNCVDTGEVVILMPEKFQKKMETDPEYAKKIRSEIETALSHEKNANKEVVEKSSVETTKKVKYQGIRTNIISGGMEQMNSRKVNPYIKVYHKK